MRNKTAAEDRIKRGLPRSVILSTVLDIFYSTCEAFVALLLYCVQELTSSWWSSFVVVVAVGNITAVYYIHTYFVRTEVCIYMYRILNASSNERTSFPIASSSAGTNSQNIVKYRQISYIVDSFTVSDSQKPKHMLPHGGRATTLHQGTRVESYVFEVTTKKHENQARSVKNKATFWSPRMNIIFQRVSPVITQCHACSV